jgi:hypothetical protein
VGKTPFVKRVFPTKLPRKRKNLKIKKNTKEKQNISGGLI